MTPGLLNSAREVLAALLDIGQTRLQVASTELEQQRLHLSRLLLQAALCFFLLGMGSIMVTLWLVVVFWDEHRLLAIGLITTAYLGGAIGCGLAWRRQARRKPAFLSTTVAELRRDGEALRHRLTERH